MVGGCRRRDVLKLGRCRVKDAGPRYHSIAYKSNGARRIGARGPKCYIVDGLMGLDIGIIVREELNPLVPSRSECTSTSTIVVRLDSNDL